MNINKNWHFSFFWNYCTRMNVKLFTEQEWCLPILNCCRFVLTPEILFRRYRYCCCCCCSSGWRTCWRPTWKSPESSYSVFHETDAEFFINIEYPCNTFTLESFYQWTESLRMFFLWKPLLLFQRFSPVLSLPDGNLVVLLLLFVVGKSVTELPVVHPLLLQGQVEHWECRVTGGIHTLNSIMIIFKFWALNDCHIF